MKAIENILTQMKGETVSNYVIAGLDSHLIAHGKIRYFENARDHQDQITPHSHRFDFTCLVVAGQVANKVWAECGEFDGDLFESSTLQYMGEIGEHTTKREGRNFWRYSTFKYRIGQCYSMKADEVHSIQFGKGAKVLFFEGPEISDTSLIIEPVVNGEVIRTYRKLEYMFRPKSN